MNEKGIQELLNDLESTSDPSTRKFAISSLKKEGESVVRMLIDRYAKPRVPPVFAHEVAEVLSSFDESAIGPLIDSISENTRSWNDIVALTLGEVQGSQALEVLLEKRQFFTTRPWATALGQIGDPRGVDPLIERLAKESEKVSEIKKEIRDKGPRGDYYGPPIGNFDDCLWALGKIGDVRAFETLKVYAMHNVISAFKGLADLGDKRANMFFHQVASREDPSSVKARAAIRGLQKLGGADYLSFFMEKIKFCIETDDRKKEVYVKKRCKFKYDDAVATLGGAILSCGEEAIEPVMEGLRDKARTRRFRMMMKHILRKIGNPSISVLLEGLQDKDKFVREASVDVLKWLKAPNAITPLVSLLKNPFGSLSFRSKVGEALREITGADLNSVKYRQWKKWLKEQDIDIDKMDTTEKLP